MNTSTLVHRLVDEALKLDVDTIKLPNWFWHGSMTAMSMSFRMNSTASDGAPMPRLKHRLYDTPSCM